MKKGKFIVFEGLDGTGKSTQLQLLASYLREKGETVFTDAEPSALPTGRLLRRMLSGEVPSSPWALAALFLADRINQNTDPENGIIKHLEAGETVILDRYYHSTFAYQGYETDMAWTMDIHDRCPEVTKPDLVLFLTMDPQKCVDRIRKNRADQALEIYETAERLTFVKNQFDRVFELRKEKDRVAFIDADGQIEEVAKRVAEAVEAL